MSTPALYFHEPPLPRRVRIAWACAGFGFCLLFWAAVSYGGLVAPFFLPTPSTVAIAAYTLLHKFDLLGDIAASVMRIVSGFGLATLTAVPLGMYLALHKKAEALGAPLLGFVRYIPPSALLPLFLLWFGIGETSKILLVCFGVMSYIALMVYDVVKATKLELVDAAYTLGANNGDVVRKVILPLSLPGIWDALRVNIGAAWTFVVLAEIIASVSGLGHLIITSQRFVQTPNVIAALCIIGILGYLTDVFFEVMHKLWFPWTEKSRNA